ncbi:MULTISPECIES: ATP-binding protein [Mycobacterium]|uniref:ATP-binding protein n=1 Tax=Mycobacterium TaxID=1763 RepID=UPI001CD93FEF|nr:MULTISPECIES: ATP-binding protein [Mycobacterium]MCA2244310.1 ATP-binding protein [Mycobacterium sp. WUMAC-067]MCA2314720.1 ATP-binding protein [Mycobacterium sp. WUMAC-025]MEE3751818.1 ATP-binding protein [Mycobacterium intracellulare]
MGRSDQPHHASNVDDRTLFVRTRVAADARSAARARAEFAAWLSRYFTLCDDRFSDLLLAVNEAIANAAEFAYVDATQRGTVDIRAAYDGAADTLAMTVDDRGRWRQKMPAQRHRQMRGRGIPLMEALADEAAIDRTPQGTRVTLTWANLTRSACNA